MDQRLKWVEAQIAEQRGAKYAEPIRNLRGQVNANMSRQDFENQLQTTLDRISALEERQKRDDLGLGRAAENNLPAGRHSWADRDGLGRPSYIELGKLFPAARLGPVIKEQEELGKVLDSDLQR